MEKKNEAIATTHEVHGGLRDVTHDLQGKGGGGNPQAHVLMISILLPFAIRSTLHLLLAVKHELYLSGADKAEYKSHPFC